MNVTLNLSLTKPLCLAPLAGVTTNAMREFFSLHGAELTHTEMISCAGLIRDNAKTFDMLKTAEHENLLIVQLFGNDDKLILDGAEIVMNRCEKISGLGINMACPMPKITRNGSGSALMRKPELAAKIVNGLKNFDLPVFVKIRKFDDDNETLKFVEILADSGADNICIHGRSPAQRYEGIADRNIISKTAKNFPGLISASGDVKTIDDINEYLSFGCVLVIIARGALNNPFIFEEYSGIFRTREEKLNELLNFSMRACEISGEHKALVLMKRFAGSVLRFTHGSAELRKLAMMSTSLEEFRKILLWG